MTKLSDARQLDWTRAKAAAQQIVKVCGDAGYIAPEALDVQRAGIARVCQQLDEIVDALLITKPVALR